jgi:hypothetical protein
VLERQIDSSVLPLPRAVKNSALAADNLLKTLAAAYFDIAKAVAQGGHQKSNIHLLQRTVNRAMLLITRRQNLAYRSYTRPSSTSWLMMHELYQIVRDQRVRHPGTNISALEQQYLSALLFAYLDPSKLPRQELAAGIFCTQQLAGHAAIVRVTPETRFHPNCRFWSAPNRQPGTSLLRMPKGTRWSAPSGRLHRRPRSPQQVPSSPTMASRPRHPAGPARGAADGDRPSGAAAIRHHFSPRATRVRHRRRHRLLEQPGFAARQRPTQRAARPRRANGR